MPIYDYVCETGHRVEVVHGVHAEGPRTCEVCGGPLRKAVSAPAIVFKGSGWAKLDARKAPAKSTTSSDGGTSETDKAGGSDKEVDKPAVPSAKPAGPDSPSSSPTDAKSSSSD